MCKTKLWLVIGIKTHWRSYRCQLRRKINSSSRIVNNLLIIQLDLCSRWVKKYLCPSLKLGGGGLNSRPGKLFGAPFACQDCCQVREKVKPSQWLARIASWKICKRIAGAFLAPRPQQRQLVRLRKQLSNALLCGMLNATKDSVTMLSDHSGRRMNRCQPERGYVEGVKPTKQGTSLGVGGRCKFRVTVWLGSRQSSFKACPKKNNKKPLIALGTWLSVKLFFCLVAGVHERLPTHRRATPGGQQTFI